MDKYICTVCDWVYDPEIGDPEHGIAPGTKFEDIPDDWVCPSAEWEKKTLKKSTDKTLAWRRNNFSVPPFKFFRYICT